MSDPEPLLLQHLSNRRYSAAATLALRSYGPEILRYLRGMLANEADALDTFSAFSERLWRSLPAFRGESTFRTWSYRLAWCAACDHRRWVAQRREDRLDTSDLAKLVAEIEQTTPPRTRTDDAWTRIEAELDATDRSLLLLRVERALPWEDVARIMTEQGGDEINPAALRKRFERLKAKLHALAEKHDLRR